MVIEPYPMLPISAPKESECGLELYLEFYYMETEQQNLKMNPIQCTSGQLVRALPLCRNSVLIFSSKVINGNFTRRYCIDIQRGNFIIIVLFSS